MTHVEWTSRNNRISLPPVLRSSSTTAKSTFDVSPKVDERAGRLCVYTARRDRTVRAVAPAATGRRKVVDALEETYPLDG